MMVKGFEFSVREFAGSLGDFGTLLPFTVGYIVICGFNPTGLLLGIGLTNIVLALIYRLPLPVQPQKSIGSVALAERWSRNTVLGAGFAVGLVWVLLSFSSKLCSILEKVPKSVTRGIQLGLAFTLALAGAEMIHPDFLIAIPLIVVAFLLLRNKFVPASIFLILFGFIYAIATGNLVLSQINVGFSLPELTLFSLDDMFYGFLYAGLAQLFLTLTNAIIATVALVHELFPDRKDVTARNLIKNMGAMNITTPFIGGMPLCHGAGGLSAQYLFGARTGGAILMEGILEISLGLFFSQSLVNIFTSFPLFVVGVMLLMTSFELGKISLKIQGKKEIYITVVTALLATVFNMAVGFIGGLILYVAIEKNIIQIR
ncbi:MAG: putative sulfate/molybdate transporter [Candidatus Bathyarchaeota archaeon]|jgi:predicted benzoate:H+ symporter BenE